VDFATPDTPPRELQTNRNTQYLRTRTNIELATAVQLPPQSVRPFSNRNLERHRPKQERIS